MHLPTVAPNALRRRIEASHGKDTDARPETSSFISKPQSQRSLTSTYTDFTRSRQALVLFMGHVVIYYGLAVVGFSFLVDNHSVIDSLYTATVIVTTIGYGDTAPDSSAARIYMMFLSTYGIVILGLVIGIMGDIIVDSQNVTRKTRRRRLQHYFLGSMGRSEDSNSESLADLDSSKSSLYGEIMSTVIVEAPIILVVFALGVMIGVHEGWTVLESIYWTAVSSFTIGFGDFTPKSASMRLFCVFYLPFSVAALGEVLSRIASVYMSRKRSTKEQLFLQQSMTLQDLRILDKNGNGKVTRLEFIEYMLVALHKVDQEDIDELNKTFERLDRDHSGTLTAEGLAASLQSSTEMMRML